MSAAIANRVGAHAEGALLAQQVRYRIRSLQHDPEIAFDALLDLVDRYGTANCTAAAAFMRELCKGLK